MVYPCVCPTFHQRHLADLSVAFVYLFGAEGVRAYARSPAAARAAPSGQANSAPAPTSWLRSALHGDPLTQVGIMHWSMRPWRT